MTMCNIRVGRYQHSGVVPEGVSEPADHWQGWIEPDDQTWIMFVDTEGKPLVFLDRDPQTGAVRG